jgi:tetratricopeptide (TPR) repeat protein
MSLKLFGWLLIISSIAPYALLVYQLRSRVSLKARRKANVNARLTEIRSRLTRVKLGDGTMGSLKMAAAVFLVVAGVGVAKSYLGQTPEATASEETIADSRSADPGDPADGDLEHLADYARSIATDAPAPAAADANKLLPDVNTMIERLAARLETAPDDIQGWRMLGWSYVNTGRYDDAANAYAKAVALDPNSPEIKRLYDEAKAKASGSGTADTTVPASPTDTGVAGPHGTALSKSEAALPHDTGGALPHDTGGALPHDTDAAIRAMVDGLADRLERFPRDVEGWTRLMRSRVVLGERDVAAAAFRTALEVFKDDSAASGQVMAMAIELGLKSE